MIGTYMFNVKCKKEGINSEKRDIANLSNRIFVCQEIKNHDKYNELDIILNRHTNNQFNSENMDNSSPFYYYKGYNQ